MKTLLLISILISFSVRAQKLDSITLARIREKLIAEELKANDTVYDGKDNCIRDNDGHFLSCFSAESSPEWVSDFNHDGNPDAVFQFMDEGLGGGGNAFGYDFRIVLLDKNQKIIDWQSFFGGGKFSFGHLSIDLIHNGKIFTTYEENPFGNINYDENIPLQNVSLTFTFENGKIVEESYKNCPLAQMEKRIFKTDGQFPIQSHLDLDDQFNEELTETIKLNDNTQYHASLSGCQDLELYFSRTIPYQKNLEKDKNAIQKILLDDLLFLEENTLFKTLIRSTYNQLQKIEVENIKIGEYGGTDLHLKLEDKWMANLFVSGNEEQGSFITFRFVKSNGDEELDFWESMEQKKKLKKNP